MNILKMNDRVKWVIIVALTFMNFVVVHAKNTIEIDSSKHELIAPMGESYQWYFNGMPVEGANKNTLSPEGSGEYSVEFIDEKGQVTRSTVVIEVNEDVITRIFIIGDSTVANYSADQYPFAGWGQVLHHFFDANKISTHNRARGGRSSRSFYEEGLWDNVVSELDSGDYVFVQFGHNDRDASNPTRYTSPEDFKIYMRIYVNGSREKGAIPVLVSPMIMNGTSNIFADYRASMLEVATELEVPFLDLNLRSLEFYQEVGVEYAKYFIHMGLEPGEYLNYPEGYSDYWTHYQEMGALAMARMITEEIREKQADPELALLADALKPLYTVSDSLNNPDAGIATIAGEYPEGATVTVKARLNNRSNKIKYWADSTNNVFLEGTLVSFTMESHDYAFIGVVADCYGTVNGTATIDECGVCTGGDTGKDPCSESVPCIDFCETNASVQIVLEDESYSLVINTDSVTNAYISQQLNVSSADTFMFSISYSNPTAGESLNVYVDDSLNLSGIPLDVGGVWNVAEFNLYLEQGEHTIRIQTNSESGGVLLDYLGLYSDNITKVDCANKNYAQETAFAQSDSLIVIEAENFTVLKAGTNGTFWTKALMDDASSGSMIIAPDGTSYGAASDAQTKAPVARYRVRFPHTGSYSIWARIYAFNDSNDSYHLGLDGKVLIEKIDLYSSTQVYNDFTWMHVADKKLNVSSTGVQDLDVFCREPNLIIDKIILSLDAGYSPSGYGPDETVDMATGLFDVTAPDMEIKTFPNPARSNVHIHYILSEAGLINISVYNATGQKIDELVNGYHQAGSNQVTWDFDGNSGIRAGLYVIRLQTEGTTRVQKIIITR